MFSAITGFIVVTVEPSYLPGESEPDEMAADPARHRQRLLRTGRKRCEIGVF